MIIEQNSTNESSSISKANEVLAAISGLESIAQLIESAIAEIDLSKEQALLAIDGRLLSLGIVSPNLEDDGNPFHLGLLTNPQPFPLITDGQGLGVDPETGLPIQGPVEAPAPVDLSALRSQVSSLEGQIGLLDGKASNAVRIASSLEGKVNTAMSVAESAFRKAMEAKSIAKSAKYDSVVDSDMETPPYVSNGGGPQ